VSKIARLQYNNVQYPYGQYVREFSSTNTPDEKYRLPQTQNVEIKYVGTLLAGQFLSVVDDSINNNNPCVNTSEAAAPADTLHSGPVQPTGPNAGTKVLVIPQTQALLDASALTQFAVCYADGTGTTSDATWRDSYIRLKISKLYSITSKRVSHNTWGQIDGAPALSIQLAGGLSSSSWLAISESSQSNFHPCSQAEAGLPSDAYHTGPSQATSHVVVMNTTGLDASREYGVCYAEGDGSTGDTTWKDSGMRVTVPKVHLLTYGRPSRSFTSSALGNARLLPRATGVVVTYSGILPAFKYFALVDETLESYNPCMTASVPSTSVDTQHSGIVTSASLKILTFDTEPLNVSLTYALCYAETDSTWRDSYMRVQLQKIRSISSSGVDVTTTGTFPFALKLEVSYAGSLPGLQWISFVAEGVAGGNPCSDGAGYLDTQHSGSFRSEVNKVLYPFTTSSLSDNQTFAVCYAENTGDASDTWVDTGMRLSFFKWANSLQNRYASGSGGKLSFTLNVGTMVGDLIAILPQDGQTRCSDAPSATTTSDGSKVLLQIDSNYQVQLPHGTQTFLTQGEYFVCSCHMDGIGGSECQNDNGAYAYIGASFTVIEQPRLGNMSAPGDLRAISGIGHEYDILGSTRAGFTLANGDKIFFRSDCSVIPASNDPAETLPLSVAGFDDTTKGAYVNLPPASGTPLQADGNSMRELRACFATRESLTGSTVLAATYVTLTDKLTIAAAPRLGPISDPGDLRAVTGSSSTYRLHNWYPGDFFFFGPSCSAVPPPARSVTATGLLGAVYDSGTESGLFSLPETTSLSTTESRTMKCCFAPAQSDVEKTINWYELPDILRVLPYPTASLTTSWIYSSVAALDFSGPTGHAGEDGDRVVLKRDNCSDAHIITALSPGVGYQYSAPMLLPAGGIASVFALAQGKVNELAMGTYKICFATKSSEYDSMDDFTTLSEEITITELVLIAPDLMVPDSVKLGVDIVVIWNATDGQYSGVSQAGSWLGLYRKAECSEVSEWQHQCYLVARELPAGESGGVVRFSQQDYKTAGEYEIRYFRGNTQHGQGQVCQGLRNTGAGVYMKCNLVAAVTSDAVSVFGTIESQDDLASVPGLEHVVLV